MEDWVPAASGWVGVEEVLGICGPEGLVELHKDLGVCTHRELLNGFLFPIRELWGEFHGVVLQDTEREGADGVCCANTAAIAVVDGDAIFGILDLLDLGVEVQARVIFLQKCGRHFLDQNVEATLVGDEVVVVTECV